MTRTPETIVVIGASVAGVSAATELRANGFDGRLILSDAGHERPHDKPALSKEFLTGALNEEDIELLTDELVGELNIELALGDPALRLEPDKRLITFGGCQLGYDGAIIATGAQPIVPPMLRGVAGVYPLRNLTDARAILNHMRIGRPRVAVVGGGFIGCEVAAAARANGLDATIIESSDRILGRALPASLAEPVAALHSSMGVDIRCSSTVIGLSGHASVSGVLLADKTVVAADLVIIGIGAAPNTQWLAGSELDVDDGILTDVALRTSAPGVFAAGDVARRPSHRGQLGLRSEHWTDARQQGALAARNLMHGAQKSYDRDSYVWSDHYGKRLQIMGSCDGALELVSGSLTGGSYVAIARRDGTAVGVVAFDDVAGFKSARKTMAKTFGGPHAACTF